MCVCLCLFYMLWFSMRYYCWMFFFFQAEDGIRDLVRSRGLGDVYKRQFDFNWFIYFINRKIFSWSNGIWKLFKALLSGWNPCLLYTSDAADERSSVDLGGRRIIKKKNHETISMIERTNSKTIKRTNLSTYT